MTDGSCRRPSVDHDWGIDSIESQMLDNVHVDVRYLLVSTEERNVVIQQFAKQGGGIKVEHNRTEVHQMQDTTDLRTKEKQGVK